MFILKKFTNFINESVGNKYINKVTDTFLPEISDEKLFDNNIIYVKYTDKPDMISYLTPRRVDQLRADKKWRTYWTTTQRQEMKIGKFLNKIFPDKKQSEIETLVNEYKSKYKIHFKIFGLELVKGEDIRKFYLYKNYDGRGGRLHGSCMQHLDDQHRFNIFVDNPDVCQLLIMRSKENPEKITGRALVWKLKDGRIFMDRVYCANDDEIHIFTDYAKANGWLAYDKGENRNKDLVVQLHSGKDYGHKRNNPYMDTFAPYLSGTNILRTRLWGEYNSYNHYYNDH